MGKGRQVVLCDKVSMRVVRRFWDGAKAAKELGTRRSSVYNACEKKAVSSGPYVLRFADEYDPNESFEGKHNRPVLATNDGDEELFKTVEEAAKSLCYSLKYVRELIQQGKESSEGWRVEYAR